MRERILALTLVAALVDCNPHMTVIPLAGLTPARPPVCLAAVKLFASPNGVQAAYTELALLTNPPTGSYDGTIRELEEKAGSLGANGFILGQTEAGYVQGTAIWIPTDSSRAATTCQKS